MWQVARINGPAALKNTERDMTFMAIICSQTCTFDGGLVAEGQQYTIKKGKTRVCEPTGTFLWVEFKV